MKCIDIAILEIVIYIVNTKRKENQMQIFISSTIYDLIDIRDEIKTLLIENNYKLKYYDGEGLGVCDIFRLNGETLHAFYTKRHYIVGKQIEPEIIYETD